MGRATLDLAMREVPDLAERLCRIEDELRHVIALLGPYERRDGKVDLDLSFQLRILQQTVREVSWMLQREEA